MKREMFWADEANGAVRYENNTIAIECSPSEARALAKQLNDTVSRFFREERPVQKVKKNLGKLTPEEKRFILLVRYAAMYVLDHES